MKVEVLGNRQDEPFFGSLLIVLVGEINTIFATPRRLSSFRFCLPGVYFFFTLFVFKLTYCDFNPKRRIKKEYFRVLVFGFILGYIA